MRMIHLECDSCGFKELAPMGQPFSVGSVRFCRIVVSSDDIEYSGDLCTPCRQKIANFLDSTFQVVKQAEPT